MNRAILLLLFLPYLVDSQCGIHRVKTVDELQSRYFRAIIGGSLVTTTKWPWQVAITRNNNSFCGGTILNNRWILTAAHCGISIKKDLVVGGVYRAEGDIDSSTVAFTSRLVEVKSHENFTTRNYDIALLKLEISLDFNEKVSPICLPNSAQIIPRDGEAVVIGYGLSNDRESTDPNNKFIHDHQLRETNISLISTSYCTSLFKKATLNSKNVICAGSKGHGTSSGDSGGPLMMKASDGRWFQLGITSYGPHPEDGESVMPHVYTDVRKYCEWIKSNTEGEVECGQETVVLQDVEIHV